MADNVPEILESVNDNNGRSDRHQDRFMPPKVFPSVAA
jgi:hypothetical protein